MKKKLNLPKYSTGVAKVAVPAGKRNSSEAGLQSGVQLAATGAAAGATFGPIGAVVGGAAGFVTGTTMGVIKQDKINNKIRVAENNNKLIDSMNKYNLLPAQYINDDSGLPELKNGMNIVKAKPVEIEGGEDVYIKDDKGNFRLKHSARGPSHKEGGIPYIAQEGDIIVPKDKANKWFLAYKNKDNDTLEAYRKELPKDKISEQKYDDGTNGIQLGLKGYNKKTNKNYIARNNDETIIPRYYLNNPGQIQPGDLGQSTPYEAVPQTTQPASNYFSNESLGLGVDNNVQPTNNDKLQIGLTSKVPTMDVFKTDGFKKSFDDNIGVKVGGNTTADTTSTTTPVASKKAYKGVGAAMTALELAPTIYNTMRGFFEEPQTQQYKPYVPKLQSEYVDVTGQLSQVDKGVSRQIDAINNYAGGNASSLMSNMNALRLQSLDTKSQITQQKAAAERELRARNIETLNQAQQYNIQQQFGVDESNMQHVAKRNDFQAQAATGISDYLQSRRNTEIAANLQRQQNIINANILAGMSDKFKGNIVFDKDGNVVASDTGSVVYSGSGAVNTNSKFYNNRIDNQVGSPPKNIFSKLKLNKNSKKVTNKDYDEDKILPVIGKY